LIWREKGNGLPVGFRKAASKGMDQLVRRFMVNSQEGGGEAWLVFLISPLYTSPPGKELHSGPAEPGRPDIFEDEQNRRGEGKMETKNDKSLILKDLTDSPLTTFLYYTIAQGRFSTFSFFFLNIFIRERREPESSPHQGGI
jgi:hypothetical protein